jgi:predicted RNA-binding protein with PUA-like domain
MPNHWLLNTQPGTYSYADPEAQATRGVGRLSVMPVSVACWRKLCEMAH